MCPCFVEPRRGKSTKETHSFPLPGPVFFALLEAYWLIATLKNINFGNSFRKHTFHVSFQKPSLYKTRNCLHFVYRRTEG